ncbi:MAG: hypothetical protein ABEJ56_03220 [Candidatus Nanohaloarchaea archaeon]
MSYDGIVFDMDRVLLDSAGDGFKWANDFRRKKAKQMGYEDFDYPEGFVFTSRSFEEMKAKVEKSRLDWDEAI